MLLCSHYVLSLPGKALLQEAKEKYNSSMWMEETMAKVEGLLEGSDIWAAAEKKCKELQDAEACYFSSDL